MPALRWAHNPCLSADALCTHFMLQLWFSVLRHVVGDVQFGFWHAAASSTLVLRLAAATGSTKVLLTTLWLGLLV